MTIGGWLEIALFFAVLTALTPLLGGYLARVYRGEVAFARPIEAGTYRLLGVNPSGSMQWKAYGRAVIAFSALSFGALYLILRTQGLHPWNPRGLTAPTWELSFNTAASFVTNTNWQYYAGETTMSHFSQMAGLAVQNFVSAAVGICIAVALIRGLASRSGSGLGSFWVDLVRTVLYVLLPISLVAALFLVSQGVPQDLGGWGPVASQEAIKELGTNGGGFFNVNSAHPFENPSWVTNFVEILLILAIPAALTSTYGRMVGSKRQGWAVYGAMLTMLVIAVAVLYAAESHATPAMQAAGVSGPNLEGKDLRFGIGSSALFAAVTTATSCGAVNAAMESLSGIGSLVPLGEMSTGEVIFGGVGSGLYGFLLMAILAVFLSGLMVGRTPEFLGKKIEAREIKLATIATIGVPLLVLVLTAVAIATDHGRVSIYNGGPQGFSETLYAYTSQANNNGSAFAGYTAYTQPDGDNATAVAVTFANVVGGLAMLLGRFLPMLAVLAIAGSLAPKRIAPPSLGTMRTDTPTFAFVVIAVIALIALLTFVPALLLGPIVQGMTDQLF
jgi:K+-transporting ATPase ATPase A chain